MKRNDKLAKLFFYLGWLIAGVISFSITFIISLAVDLFLFTEVFGDTIIVDGQKRITEDYMLPYAFIPWFGIVIGLMQYLILKLRMPASRWWILTTTIGWSFVFLGLGLYYRPIGTLRIPESVWYLVMAGIALGLLIGFAQWVILRAHVPGAAWWIPANMIGFGIAGFILGDISGIYGAILAFTVPLITTGAALLLFLDVLPGGNKILR